MYVSSSFLQKLEIEITEKICDNKNDNSMLPEEKIVEKPDSPQPDSTTDNIVEDADTVKDANTVSGETPKEDKNESRGENVVSTEICMVVNGNCAISTGEPVDR